MEFRELRYFKAIADAKSFARGANQLHVAQPALSRSIAKLESEIGREVFVRHSWGVSLTEAGTLLYEHATSIIRSMQRINDEMSSGVDVPHGCLSFGAPPSLQFALTAPVAAEFMRTYPQVPLSLFQETSVPLRDEVETGKVDLAIISTIASIRGLHVTPLFSAKFNVICRRADRHQFGAIARVKDLLDLPLVISGNPSSLEPNLAEAFARFEAKPNIRAEVSAGTLVADLVAEGAGIGVAGWGTVHPSRLDELQTVPLQDLAYTFVIITSHERRDVAAVRKMTQMLLQHSREVIGRGLWPLVTSDEPTS